MSEAALPQPRPAASAAPIEEEERPSSAYSIRNVTRLLVASRSGQLGIALFIVMVAISIYVVIAFPSNFGTGRWSNPAYWADNPRAVPPKWTAWLGKDALEHRHFELSAPTQVTPRGTGEIRDYAFPITYDSD